MEAGAGITRRATLGWLGGALAGGLTASACGAPRAGSGAPGTPVAAGSLVTPVPPPASSQRSPELVWRRQIPGAESLAVSGDTVILGTEGLDAATGDLRWSIGRDFKPPSVAFGAGGGMVLCIGTSASGDDNITALSPATGHPLWTAPAYDGNPNNGPGPWLTFAGADVYALIGLPGSHQVYLDDVVLALDGRTGARKWMSRLPPMATAMAVADGTVYAGSALGARSRSGEVVALDGATGARRWSARLGAPVGALAVTGGVVAVCWDTLDQGPRPLMSGLNAADGRVLWQRDLAVTPGIAAADGVIFASDFVTSELMAVDALTGELIWKHAEIEHWPSAPAVAGGAVYVGYLNSVQAFSARTGEQLWDYPAEGQITKLAAGGGILYAAVDAAGPASQLYALRG